MLGAVKSLYGHYRKSHFARDRGLALHVQNSGGSFTTFNVPDIKLGQNCISA